MLDPSPDEIRRQRLAQVYNMLIEYAYERRAQRAQEAAASEEPTADL